MGMCKECLLVFPTEIMTDGYCPDCLDKGNNKKEQEEKKLLKLEELKKNKTLLDNIYLTTETSINNINIENRICIVSSQCVYGLNIVKDIFSSIRNIVGGRVKSIEEAIEEANIQVLEDLKIKAFLEDGNAVIGVRIEHTYNNANNGSILSIFATGTVVKI